MRVIDTTTLLCLFHPDVAVPKDGDGKLITSSKQRIEHLIETLEAEGSQLIIPTPVLSELLVRATDAQVQEILQVLSKRSVFQVEPFDEKAAIELALMNRADLPNKKRKVVGETAAKVKLDRQIVAIGKVNAATIVYSDDKGLRTFAKRHGLTPIGLGELALPPKRQQIDAFEGGH